MIEGNIIPVRDASDTREKYHFDEILCRMLVAPGGTTAVATTHLADNPVCLEDLVVVEVWSTEFFATESDFDFCLVRCRLCV